MTDPEVAPVTLAIVTRTLAFARLPRLPAPLRIPVLRDHEADLVLTESDAILLHLADKAGRLVPSAGKDRMRAIELLFLQASLQRPMFGQRMQQRQPFKRLHEHPPVELRLCCEAQQLGKRGYLNPEQSQGLDAGLRNV